MDVMIRSFNIRGLELSKEKSVKLCVDIQCFNLVPLCCLHISAECSDNLTKWYHLSNGEHICNACCARIISFFSYNTSCTELLDWKRRWMMQSFENAAVNDYISNHLLATWCRCIDCGKWRQVCYSKSLSPTEIDRFNCSVVIKHSIDPCEVPEEQKVALVKSQSNEFIQSLDYSVLLEAAPYSYEIFHNLPLDVVGICPVSCESNIDFGLPQPCKGFLKRFHPFLTLADNHSASGAVDPTTMDRWELATFPTFKGVQRGLFVALRNLLMLLWAADPKRPVDERLINRCLLLRGLVRVVVLHTVIPDMLRIYTGLGIINFGFISVPRSMQTFADKKPVVIVVGGSISGLAAAHQLRILGADVTVIEASSPSSQSQEGTSKIARLTRACRELDGLINNPLAVLAYQLDIDLEPMEDELVILDPCTSEPVDSEEDLYYQTLVYQFIPYLEEHSGVTMESDLGATMMDAYSRYKLGRLSSNKVVSDNATGIEAIYLAEIEYRVFGGASLSQVPVTANLPRPLPGDPCRPYGSQPRFCGGPAAVVSGNRDWTKLVEKLALSSDDGGRYNTEIVAVHSKPDGGWTLTTGGSSDNSMSCDMLLLAMSPVSRSRIRITDHLEATPWPGQDDSDTLILISLSIISSFWATKTAGRSFSFLERQNETQSDDLRGFCHVFKQYGKKLDGTTAGYQAGQMELQTQIFGVASLHYSGKSDSEIVACVLNKLRGFADPTGAASADVELLNSDVVRIEGALQSAKRHSQSLLASEADHHDLPTTLVLTNKVGNLAEPVSLTNSFCEGVSAAVKLARHTFLQH